MSTREQLKENFLPPLWIFTVLFVVLFFWLLIELKEIVVLLVVGFSIAYVMEPALAFLERRRISRSFGVVVILTLFTITLILLALTAIPTILREYQELVQKFPHYISVVKNKLLPFAVQFKDYVPVEDLIISPLDALSAVSSSGAVGKISTAVSKALLQGYSITLTLVNLALLPFIVFYLAVDFSSFESRFLSFFRMTHRDRVREILREMNSYVAAFVRGQILVCSILFLLYAAGLGLIGVELWFLVAVIAGFGNMVPYLGFLVGIVLASIMALVTFGDFVHLFLVWGVFAVVQFLEGTFITPRILGEKVGLSPLIIILAIVAGGKLFGLLGIFLAVPAAAVLKVLGSYLYSWVLSHV